MNRPILGLCTLVCAVAPANAEPSRAESKSFADAVVPAPAATSRNVVPLPTILRPAPRPHTLVYHADSRGQFSFTAAVNGAPVRFLVDTGATLVALTLEDARAAGFDSDALVFNVRTRTANGMGLAARVMLREIRIDQLSIDNVPALVERNLSAGSVLGMSFLRRVRFEMREGTLTISW